MFYKQMEAGLVGDQNIIWKMKSTSISKRQQTSSSVHKSDLDTKLINMNYSGVVEKNVKNI